MTIEDRVNGNGRRTFSFSLKPDIMNEFKAECDKIGLAISKRLEIAILHDIQKIKQLQKIHNYSPEVTANGDDTSGSVGICNPEKISTI